MTEFPRNDLETAMLQAADDPVARPDFYAALLQAKIYVIGDVSTDLPDGEFRISEGDTISLANFEFEDGQPYIPFFTSLDALNEAVSGETPYLSIGTRELLDSTRGNFLVLNPGQDIAKEFTPEEITHLLDGTPVSGTGEYQLDRDVQVQIGQPAEEPVELIDALTRLFSRHGAVKRAFYAQMLVEAQEKPLSLVVALDADGSVDRLIGDMQMVIPDTAPDGLPVDVVLLGQADSLVDSYFQTTEIPPFYERSWGQRLRGFFVRS
jgi:SseB protein C-terminal domain/SseB protein N-terminal domain